MNVLITSASRKVALVRAFQRALDAEGGGHAIAGDISPYAASLYIAQQHVILPRQDHDSYLVTLLETCRRNSIRLLIPTRDEELLWFAERRDVLAQAGVTTMIASRETIRMCQDKRNFVTFCMQHGFDIPRTYEATETPSKFPVFVKPRWGRGGERPRFIHSAAEFSLAVGREPDEMIIQDVVEEPEYTIDVFADFGGTVISAVPRERVRVVGGESVVTRTAKCDALIDESIRLATTLKVVGQVAIQAFYAGRSVRFIEVNARFGGASNLSIAAGADSPRWLIQLVKGVQVAPQIGNFRDGYVMLRYGADLFISE